MIALIAIPHQTPAQIHWYDDAGTLIAEAEEYADQAGHEPPESHGFDDPLANAAHELADDWHGHLLIRTAADVEELRSYDGHQSCRIAAMLDELADEFAPNPPEPPPTRIDVNDLRGNPEPENPPMAHADAVARETDGMPPVAKHTPGPCVAISRHNGTVNIETANGKPLGMSLKCDRLTWDEVRYNAKLWAAAPDLLEALTTCAEWIESAADDLGEDSIVARTARAAIAKATSEEMPSE